jgi:transcriptional regulator with XRE-family HTH domain
MICSERQWARVSELVVQRMNHLGIDGKTLAQRTGLSHTLVGWVVNNRKGSYRVGTLRTLCEGLGWTPSSINHILNGGGPELANIEQETVAAARPVRSILVDGEVWVAAADIDTRTQVSVMVAANEVLRFAGFGDWKAVPA